MRGRVLFLGLSFLHGGEGARGCLSPVLWVGNHCPLLGREKNSRSCWNTSREHSWGEGRKEGVWSKWKGQGGLARPEQTLERWQEDHAVPGHWERGRDWAGLHGVFLCLLPRSTEPKELTD